MKEIKLKDSLGYGRKPAKKQNKRQPQVWEKTRQRTALDMGENGPNDRRRNASSAIEEKTILKSAKRKPLIQIKIVKKKNELP